MDSVDDLLAVPGDAASNRGDAWILLSVLFLGALGIGIFWLQEQPPAEDATAALEIPAYLDLLGAGKVRAIWLLPDGLVASLHEPIRSDGRRLDGVRVRIPHDELSSPNRRLTYIMGPAVERVHDRAHKTD